jgi:integrase
VPHLDVPFERSLVELTITTGLRSGEIRGLVWDAVDLTGKRLFVERQATRRRDDDTTKTESSLRTVPVPGYLIPELKRWNAPWVGIELARKHLIVKVFPISRAAIYPQKYPRDIRARLRRPGMR